jgi:hypothetical protein
VIALFWFTDLPHVTNTVNPDVHKAVHKAVSYKIDTLISCSKSL